VQKSKFSNIQKKNHSKKLQPAGTEQVAKNPLPSIRKIPYVSKKAKQPIPNILQRSITEQ